MELYHSVTRGTNDGTVMFVMDVKDRYVVVEAHALDDLCEVSAKAAAALLRASASDPIALALRGARAQVLASAALEPSDILIDEQ